MHSSPFWTERDVLHVVQSMAQAQSGKSGRKVSETSLFLEIQRSDAFSPAQIQALACEALHFFSLAPSEGTDDGLQAELAGQPEFAAWAKSIFARWNKAAICFRSSGSTGIPTRHCFPIPLLGEEMHAAMPRFRSRRRIISVMPVHHIYGMMYGPLLAKYLEVPLLFAPPLPLSSFFAMVRPGDLVVAFPLFWNALLTMRGDDAVTLFPEDVAGLTATSPCPAEVLHSLITPSHAGTRPLLANITEIYGSTETNGIGLRRDGEAWYELFSCWKSETGAQGIRRIRRIHEDGTLGERLPLPDIAVWHDDRRFVPERRGDNAVQVGGINVYPEKVAALIRTHPLVRDCAVRLMRPEEGARLKAFIVPALPKEQAAKAFGKSFHTWLAARLETASRPKRITLGDALPTNSIGKSSDWD